MKHVEITLQALVASAIICGSTPVDAASPKVIEYYSFDKKEYVHPTVPIDDWEKNGCRLPENSYIDSEIDPTNKTWDLTVKENGATPDNQTKIVPGSLGTGRPDYGNYIQVAGTDSYNGLQSLYAPGAPLSLSKSAEWHYSITMWVNPVLSGTNGKVTFFSIGTETNGLRFKCRVDKDVTGTTTASYLECDLYAMLKVNGEEKAVTLSFGEVLLDHNFTGEQSNWHHLGVSFGKDTNNNLTVNYYSEGSLINPEAGIHQSSLGNEFSTVKTDKGVSLNLDSLSIPGLENISLNGLNINSDGLDGVASGGSVRYDDIKIYDDLLLDPEDIKDSMQQGPGAVPETSTSSLALLGLAGLVFRRRL